SEHPAPSHLILDLKSARRSGFDVLEWLRHEDGCKDLPVVALTSSGDPGDRDRAQALAVDAYFLKPSRHSDLVEIVRTIASVWGLPTARGDEVSASSAGGLAAPSPALLSLFPGDGEIASLMRRLDWTRTPLGPVATWPEHLRSAVRICVSSTFPM